MVKHAFCTFGDQHIGDFFVLEMMRMTIMMVTKGADDDDGGVGVGDDGGNCDGDQGCRAQTSERGDDQRRETRMEQGTSC